ITIRNTSGSYPSVGTVGAFCSDFDASFGISLLAGTSATRTVRFHPTREGPQCCAVDISCRMDGEGTNAGTNQWLTVRGTGVGGSPACQLSTTTIDFGQVPVGQTKDLTLTVTNTGGGVLAGSVGPSTCSVFSFVGSTSYSLGAGQSQAITIRFTPN